MLLSFRASVARPGTERRATARTCRGHRRLNRFAFGAAGFRASEPLRASPPGMTIAVWGGFGRYLFPDCQHISSDQPSDFTHLPKIAASPARHSWGLWETPPVPSHGRLARPAIRSGGGSGWSGISLCKQGGRTAIGDLLRVGRPGWRTGGDTQVVPGLPRRAACPPEALR